MFCTCEIIQIFAVVFCVVRAVDKFDFKPVLKKLRHIVEETHVFDRICMFLPACHSDVKRGSSSVKVNCILLSKTQHIILCVVFSALK